MDKFVGLHEFQELLLSAPVLIAVQQGERLQVQPVSLFTRKPMSADELAALLPKQTTPALERWLRAKAEEVIRSGQPAIGVEEPLRLEGNEPGKSAETRYLTYVCGPLRRGAALEGAATFAIDVTASVLAQASAPRDRKWLEAAMNAIGTPIVLAEPDTERIWFVNRSARELSPCDLGDGAIFGHAVGLDAGFFCTDPAGARIPADQLPGARASRGEVVDAMELSWHTPSGGVLALLCFAEKVRASGTLPSILVLSFFDVTHLNAVERRLSELLSGRDDFLRLAGHELRTPITALKLHAQSLRRKYPEVSGLAAIERATVRMETLTEDMLACADILEHGIRLEPEELDLCTVADEVTKRLKDEAQRADCSIARTGAQRLRGRWDRTRMEQALVHLVRNAIRFGAGKPVCVECLDHARCVSIAVVDHGIGIAPVDQQRIFQRFGRPASSPHFAGLGVGLWMVREIVEKMGGSIRVDSAPGEGATFTIELPHRT